MSMIGELSFFLGSQVKQMKEGVFISQEMYTQDLLKRFEMMDCKPIKTPMASNGHLDLDEGGNPIDKTLYRSMIGSILYLTASRPDIMFSVCLCARYQAMPMESHLIAVKRILKYLNTHLAQVCGIPKVQDSNLQAIPIRIMPGAGLIEKAHPDGAISQVDHLSLGCQRNKIVLPCQRPKRNTLPSVLVVHKYFI